MSAEYVPKDSVRVKFPEMRLPTEKEAISTNQEWMDKGERYFLETASGGRILGVHKHHGRQMIQQTGGGDRDEVREFSQRSVKKMRRRLFSIDRDKADTLGYNVFFITLTYPEVWPKNGEKIKRDLDVFMKRWNRKQGRSFSVWKLEEQKRGAPHYHLLIFTADAEETDRKELNEWVGEAWPEIIFTDKEKHQWTDGSRTKQPTIRDEKLSRKVTERRESVEYVKNLHDDRIIDYVMKYSTKRGKSYVCLNCGASWGPDDHTGACQECGGEQIRDNRNEWGERWGIRNRERYQALVEWSRVELEREEYEAICILAANWLKDARDIGGWLQSDEVADKTVFMSTEKIQEILQQSGVIELWEQSSLDQEAGRKWMDENSQSFVGKRHGREPPPERKTVRTATNGPHGNNENAKKKR
jgi:hypothetical protein